MRYNFTFIGSSMLLSCWHDDEIKELGIMFHNGREYIYEDVDPLIYQTLTTVESAGKYFASIKNNLTVKK